MVIDFPALFRTSSPLKRRRVLCADDHPQMADLLRKVLLSAGHEVVCVTDGAEALKRLEHDSFDVLVTDHHMPVLSGLELVAQLKQRRFTGQILLLTSELTSEEEAEYRRLGVSDIIMKPGGILRIGSFVK